MASSYTGLGTELMTTGENAGTWGSTTNTNLQIIEQISGGYTEQSIAGSADTTTLSVSDGSTGAVLGHRVIKFTGTITGNQIVTIPLDVQQLYVLVNGTSGAYTVQFKYASGSGSSVTFAATDKGSKLVYATADHATNPNLVDSGIASTGDHDLDGNELILDADADTSITADTDDQIDIKIAGADDFQFTANTFTAQAGSTIAAQALTATTITASGIVKTDDTTEATSTTDGSLQTDGGLSVAKDAVFGDDVKLLSDSAVLSFGADSDTTLTHTDGTGLTLNSTNKLLFGDTGTYIHQSADGVLDLVSDTELELNATTIDINGNVEVSGSLTGAGTVQGTTITATTAFVPDASDGAALGTSALEFSDLFLADGAVISFGDDQEITLTHVADDGLILKHVGTGDGKEPSLTFQAGDNDIAVDDVLGSINFQAPDEGAGTDAILVAAGIEAVSEGNFSSSNNATKLSFKTAASEAAAEKMALSSTGALTLHASGANNGIFIKNASDATNVIDFARAAATTSRIRVTEPNATHTSSMQFWTSDASGSAPNLVLALTIDDGQDATFTGEVAAASLDISGAIDVDGATNLDAVDIDGAVQLDATLTVGVDDTGYDVKFFGDTASAYMLWDTSVDDLILGGAARIVVPDSQLVLGSTAVTATAAEINLIDGGASTGTTAVADADGILTNDGGTMRLTTAATFKTYFQTGISSAADDISVGDAAVSITTSSGDITIDAAANNSDIIFKGTDATSDITMLTLDGSEAGAATFNDKVVATELDISGNCDIDGTTNLDAVDIDGAVQIDATFTSGVDGQGYDTKFFGDTSSAYMLWDTSADDLILAGGAGLIVPDGQFTLGSTAVGSTAAELNLLDGSAKSTSSITLADSDAIIVIDGTTTKQIPASDLKTYNPGGTSWQAVKTGAFTAAAGQGVFVNTTSSAFTITLPAGSIGDEVSIIDYAGTFDSNNCTIAANGSEKIHGSTDDLTVATERAAFTLVFTDSTQGWLLKDK